MPRMLHGAGWGLVALWLMSAARCSKPAPAQSGTGSAPPAVVARIGEREVTLEEVDKRALLAEASDYAGLKLLYALYEARREVIEQIVADHLMVLEAKARGISTKELFEREVTAKAPPVSEAEVEAWYRQNPDRVRGAALEEVRAPIRQLLERERRHQALAALLATLKRKTAVTILLDPPRQQITVADGEPAVGPPGAPVEIVEYSDFQ